MDMFSLDWRDGVLVIAGLIGVYLALLVMRLMKVGKKPARHAPAAVSPAPTFGSDEALVDLSREIPDGILEEVQAAGTHGPVGTEREWPLAGFAAAGATAWAGERATQPAAPSNDTPIDFADQLQRSSVEAEVQLLRRESKALREELTRLREELSSLKAARNVSPLYSEAMSLAQNGVPADGIAGQCGISLAEAELVAALARGETPDDEPYLTGEEPNDGYPDPRSRTGTHG